MTDKLSMPDSASRTMRDNIGTESGRKPEEKSSLCRTSGTVDGLTNATIEWITAPTMNNGMFKTSKSDCGWVL